MRITNGMLTSRALRGLQTNYAGMARIQEQVSSAKRLNRPSDDPALVRSAVRVRETLSALDQHLRNIDTADRATSVAETALASGGDMMQRVKELALQAANDTLSATDRTSILQEVQQLGEAIVAAANSRNGDDYVFSGQLTKTPAYAGVAAPYGGDAGAINARISPGVAIQVNIPGDVAFGSALSAINQLMTDLGTGARPSAATIQGIDNGLDGMLTARTQLGAIVNRLSTTREFVESSQYSASKLLSDLEDADMPTVISKAAERQTTYEAALAVNAKILRRSLVDEL